MFGLTETFGFAVTAGIAGVAGIADVVDVAGFAGVAGVAGVTTADWLAVLLLAEAVDVSAGVFSVPEPFALTLLVSVPLAEAEAVPSAAVGVTEPLPEASAELVPVPLPSGKGSV